MATPLALVWDLIAKDNASAAFHRVGAAAKTTAAETESMGSKFAKAGTLIGVAAIGVAAVSAKMAISFQESTTKIVTGAGESEEAIGMVRKGILDMAGSVGTMPEELSKGMYLIESAGYRGAKGLNVLKAAAEGAKVGGADMATVADGLTTALTDYHLPTSRAAEITSKLVATVGAGKTTMEDLAGSMAKVLPFSANLGVSFKETMGAMATMTGEGIDAASAATMLKFTMMSLSNETPKGQAALKAVGLTAQDVTKSLGDKGLNSTLSMVIDAIGKKFPKGSAAYNQALAAVVGGTRGMGATLAITGKHAKTFADNVKTIGGSAADADGHVKNFAETQKDVAFQMDKLKAGASALAIELGMELLPKITQAITFFNQHKTVTKDLGIAVVSLGGFLLSYSIATKIATATTATYNLVMKSATFLTGEAAGKTANLKMAMLAAGVAAVAYGGHLSQTHKKLGALTTAAGGAAAGFAVAGPWGAAIGGAGGLLYSFMRHTDNAKAAQKRFANELGDVTDLLNHQTGALKRSAAAAISKQLSDSGAYAAARRMGISLRDVKLAAEGNTASIQEVTQEIGVWKASVHGAKNENQALAKNADVLSAAVGGTNKQINKARQGMIDQATAAGHLSRALSMIHAPKVDMDTSAFRASLKFVYASMARIGRLSTSAQVSLHASDYTGHNAAGTDYWRGGLTWVGEKGPELINLRKGAQVIPNDKSMALMGGGTTSQSGMSREEMLSALAGMRLVLGRREFALAVQDAGNTTVRIR